MKVLFENDDIPTEIKDKELFNRMESEPWDIEDEEVYDDIDEITGKFVSRCCVVHLQNGETHQVESSIVTDIAYGNYMKVE